MTIPENTTREGNHKVRRFTAAAKTIERIKRDLTSAETEMTNATNDLGEWLVPDDAKIGEVFHVWFADGIIQAELVGAHDFKVSWRKRPSLKTITDLAL